MKTVSGIEHLSSGGRLRELELFNLEKGKLWANIIVAFPYVKGTYKIEREGLFTRACSDRKGNNRPKLKEGRVRLNIRKKIFTMRLDTGTDQRICVCPILGSFQGHVG